MNIFLENKIEKTGSLNGPHSREGYIYGLLGGKMFKFMARKIKKRCREGGKPGGEREQAFGSSPVWRSDQVFE